MSTRTSPLVAWLERRINLTELLSFVTHFGLVHTPIDTTRPVGEVADGIARRPVPAYERGPRLLGVLTVLLFGIEAVTGMLLAFYYRPTPESAFPSTRMIVRDVPLGWFVHQVHAWGAYALVAAVTVRLARLFWDGLYRAPRELLWCAAVCMTWLAVQADMTGRLLTWDAQSYWGAVRGLEVLYALPVVGSVLAYLVGGRVVNEDVLIRFYILHITVLPLLFAGAIYVTYATVRRVGLSPARGERTIAFRDHVVSLVTLCLLVFAALVTLAALVPFRFGAPADPFATPVGARPPWYFLAPYALLQRAPGPRMVRGLVWLVAVVGVLLLPFLVRGEAPAATRRARMWGALAVLAWCALGAAGFLVERR